MRKWLTSFILVTALVGGATGVRAHEGEGSMANMPDCCKKAQSASNAPAVSMARLCCNLNCSESGSTGSNASSNPLPQPSIASNSAMMPSAVAYSSIALTNRYAHSLPQRDSSPKYIEHLALLI